MRLIDADALKEWIDEYVSVFKKSDNKDIKGYIEHQPTIEPKRGEWIQKPHKVYLPRDCEPLFEETYNEADHSIIEYWWHCNQCDYEADRSSKPIFKFCPNCGADMRKESE